MLKILEYHQNGGDMWKKTTKGDIKYRIYATDGRSPYTIHGAVYIDNNWVPIVWRNNGQAKYEWKSGDYDLVKIPELKKDDPVIVWNDGFDAREHRHFSHFENNVIYCFMHGKTSWTANYREPYRCQWDHFEIPDLGTNTGE